MTFSHLISTFFQKHLAAERGLPASTIASYSDCFRLLISFVCKRFNLKPEAISLDNFNRELIIDFLEDLEKIRHNGVSTRNQRLAAIKTFFHFVAYNVPERMHLNETIQAICQKKTDYTPPPSMTIAEVEAILAVPDTSQLIGARDKALLALLYNSGGRVQETADLKTSDIHFNAATVTLTGKGGKTRIIPLRAETLEAISFYIKYRGQSGIQSDHLFLNIKGKPMTRFGIGRRVGELAKKAATACPSLLGRTITPHVFRHTIALHLIESGVDIVLVKEWLGHEDLRTTSQYLEVSVERKRAALDKVPPPEIGNMKEPEIAHWKQPAIMTFLTNLSHGVMLHT